jgi:26S proteasome regulatory subunit T5
MASLEDLEDLERDQQDRKRNEEQKKDGDGNKMELDEQDKHEDGDIDPDVLNASTSDIVNRRRLLENDLRVMKQEFQRLTHEKSSMKDKIKDNLEKIENNRSVKSSNR